MSAELYGETGDGAPLRESLQAMVTFAGKGFDTGLVLGPAGQRAAASVRCLCKLISAGWRRVVMAAVVQ